MELKFNNVWGGPVSLQTMSVVFLIGLILTAIWILLRKATNPRISGMGPVLLLVLLAWYGCNTVTIAKLGVQVGVDPMARNLTLARSFLVGWWLLSGAAAYLVSRHVNRSQPKAAA